MKAYLITSGGVFGLLVVAHLARIVDEGAHVARDPWFVLSSIASAILSVWAFLLLRVAARHER